MDIFYDINPQNANEAIATGRGGNASNNPHWIIALLEGMRMIDQLFNINGVDNPVRVKRILYENKVAFLMKNARTRARIIAFSSGNTITTMFGTPKQPVVNEPHLPLYPRAGEPECEEMTWSISPGQIPLMTQYCWRKITQDTYFSNPKHLKQTVSFKKHIEDGSIMQVGRITSVAGAYGRLTTDQIKDGKTDAPPIWVIWTIDPDDPDKEVSYVVSKHAIRYSVVKPGNFLIFKNLGSADIVNRNELLAFYNVLEPEMIGLV